MSNDILTNLEDIIAYCACCSDDLIELQERVERTISEENIIGSKQAKAFLTEHDGCLRASLALAVELEYSTRELSNELLASILYRDLLFKALADIDLSDYLSDGEEV